MQPQDGATLARSPPRKFARLQVFRASIDCVAIRSLLLHAVVDDVGRSILNHERTVFADVPTTTTRLLAGDFKSLPCLGIPHKRVHLPPARGTAAWTHGGATGCKCHGADTKGTWPRPRQSSGREKHSRKQHAVLHISTTCSSPTL